MNNILSINKFFCLIVLVLLFSNLSFSQGHLLLKNEKSSTEKVIKEGKRIRLKTTNGKKIKGRYIILNDSTIFIKKDTLALSQIVKIKRDPLALAFINGAFACIGGGLISGGLILYPITGGAVQVIYVYIVPGVSFGVAGLLSPNFLKGYHINKQWGFELNTNPNK